ncbi:ATP-grasp domain-containing protein [Streptomyces sp. NPDC001228]|uniref:ATP-grasp domain-containing protein n=1 Tax=Streptomyces sp. NPDC001228 TaxID=3154381 RepID=UPI00332DEF98
MRLSGAPNVRTGEPTQRKRSVSLRGDRNPFHHGTLGAVPSLGRAGVDVHLVADSTGSPVGRSRFVRQSPSAPRPCCAARTRPGPATAGSTWRPPGARAARRRCPGPGCAGAGSRPPRTPRPARPCRRPAREARELFGRTEEAGSRLLLQEFLPPGPDRDWFFHGYADRTGLVRAGGPGRKQRSWPRGAGLTAVGLWVQGLAERLTGELGYRGIFDLDFRRCGDTGRYHLLDFNPRPGAQFRLFTDGAGLDVVRALRPAPRGRELAWSAPDDRGPGLAMWALWGRHVAGRLFGRLRPARTPVPRVAPVVVRQAGQPADERCPAARDEEPAAGPGPSDRSDDEKASSR